jgi:serine/threonine protein kinase
MTPAGPEPGWYFDPDGGEHERFWNGEAWTEHRRSKPSTFNPPPQLNSETRLRPRNDERLQLHEEAEAQVDPPDGEEPQRRQSAKTRHMIQRDKLGMLSKIGQGGQGVVYRAPNVKTKFADSMVYKEYKAPSRTEIDFTALTAMPALVEEALTYSQGERLISSAAWPCAIVEDAGTPTGFVMPAIPDEFFIPLTTVKGVSTTAAEFQHLLNHPSVLAARGITLNDAQRYALLRETASALAFLHKHGVCVGDISPKNLLFSLTPHEAVYFIDCDAMRINGVSALSQVETPGWNAPSGEELATIYTDTYKLGLLALRLLTGDQDTTNRQHLPSATPTLLRQIITDTLTNPPHRRPLPEAWTYVLGHAIEEAQYPQKTTPTGPTLVSAAPAPPPIPTLRSRPPVPSAPPVRPPLAFSAREGTWAKVVAASDDFDGQMGKIVEICDADDDDLDVILEFRGYPDTYAFRRDELVAAAPPAAGQSVPSAPPDGDGFWFEVGIDPIRIITSAGDFLTLRCYLDDAPIFLGRNGLINVFRSGRALRRYLADNPPNDMSSLSTYPDITIAANAGSLPMDEVTEDNVYVLKGLTEDIAAGPDRVDRLQLELAVELLSDLGKYVKNTMVEDYLRRGQPLGDLVNSVLARSHIRNTGLSPGDGATQWAQLEEFLESRLSAK